MFSEIEDLYLALMTWKEPDWQGFEPIDTDTWWKGILRELKGEPREKLDWRLDPVVGGAPFFLEEGNGPIGPLTGGRSTSDWGIMEWIPDGLSAKETNALILDSLRGGAQSLALPAGPGGSLGLQLSDVFPDIAPLFWRVNGHPGLSAFLEELASWAGEGRTYAKGAPLLGGFIDPMPWDSEKRARELFPEWSFCFASSPGVSAPVEQLRMGLELARDAIRRSGTQRGHLFRLEVGNDFIGEIVRIRAWRILWGHLMESFGFPGDTPCTIVALLYPDAALPWENAYIAAATRALGAVLGGVDQLAVIPPPSPEMSMARRVARNVQHLMKEEGRLHLVTDPMAGSHAIEQLTLEVAEKAWDAFSG